MESSTRRAAGSRSPESDYAVSDQPHIPGDPSCTRCSAQRMSSSPRSVPPSSPLAQWWPSTVPPQPRPRRAARRASGGLAVAAQFKGEAAHVFDFFTTDTKLTWRQIGADLIRGETLGQIAGARTAKVEADALAEVQAGVSLGIARGAITAAEETRLVNDAREAVSVLMAAKLSALLPAGR